MTARLVHVLLSQYDGAAEPREHRGRRMRPEFFFDELRFRHGVAEPERTSVEVAFSFVLSDAEAEVEVAQISACFRLLFESTRAPEDAERHAIIIELAPREAWPLFRAHVDRTLAEMGFPPYHGNRQISPVMMSLAQEVLAETVRVDRELAQKSRAREVRRR